MSDIVKEILDNHNKLREKHHSPPMVLNNDISKFSQNYADKLLKSGKMVHSSDTKYGENLFTCKSSNKEFKPTGDMPTNSWYSEIKDFKFGKEPKSLNAGHFTQLIWKDSKELGVGVACKNGQCFVVCNYFPPGNVVGHYNENVLPE